MYFTQRLFTIGLFSSLILTQSCSFLAEQESPTPIQSDTQTPPAPKTAEIAEPERYGNFSTETLYSLMVAELAATRKKYDVTLSNYVDEAQATGDLGIIARAARLAQYFRSNDQSLAMGQLWLEQTPNDIEANSIVATAYIESRQPLEALDYAEKILALLNPEDKESNKSAAITETIANYSRDLDTLTRQQLIKRYHGLANQYPGYSAIKVGLSTLYESQKDTATAYQIIQDVLTNDSDYLPAIMQEIRLLQASKQTELAAEKLKGYLAKRPDDNRLRLLYARLLTQTDVEAAYREFSLLSAQSPNHLDIKFSKALIALEINKREESEQLLDQLLNVGYRPNTIHFYLGNLAELDKNYEKALSHYLAINGGNDYIASHSRAARIMATQGDIEQAQAHLRKLRAESPNQRAQLYSAEAEVLESLDKIEPAIAVLTQGITESPDNINLRYTRSSLYEKTDQLALMESDLRHILTQEPENAAALNALGYFLTSRTDRHQEALALIEKALSIKPDDPAIMDSMGWALFNLGRTEEAILYLKKAFELFPDPEVAAHLGEALWVNGNKQEAHNIWTNNLKDNPNDSRILDTMERLQVTP
ncbi:MAG: tetratricopeptide repeat protein [Cellvibrionaceae bacterium]